MLGFCFYIPCGIFEITNDPTDNRGGHKCKVLGARF